MIIVNLVFLAIHWYKIAYFNGNQLLYVLTCKEQQQKVL